MGCDIHAYIEIPLAHRPTGWDFFAKLDVDRNYSLFGLMAGVRAERKLFDPKGIPRRMSLEVSDEWDGGIGWHTPSWLTADEFARVVDELDAPPVPYAQARAILAALRELPGSRLVFWFDN